MHSSQNVVLPVSACSVWGGRKGGGGGKEGFYYPQSEGLDVRCSHRLLCILPRVRGSQADDVKHLQSELGGSPADK